MNVHWNVFDVKLMAFLGLSNLFVLQTSSFGYLFGSFITMDSQSTLVVLELWCLFWQEG